MEVVDKYQVGKGFKQPNITGSANGNAWQLHGHVQHCIVFVVHALLT
jgi:hypothetical protein